MAFNELVGERAEIARLASEKIQRLTGAALVSRVVEVPTIERTKSSSLNTTQKTKLTRKINSREQRIA